LDHLKLFLGLTNSIRPLLRHTPRSHILEPNPAQKLSPAINVELVGSLEVFGRYADETTAQPHTSYSWWVTKNIGNLGKLRQPSMLQA
jgi:hypothetical protein